MAGNKAGAQKAAKTIKQRHGEDFYRRIGHIGGSATPSQPRGFASQVVGKDGLTGLERARIAGSKGGTKSRRGPAKKKKDEDEPRQEERKRWRLFKRR